MRDYALLALGLTVLAGCGGKPGGLQDAMSYDSKSITHVKMSDDTYRVFDHPAGDRIMTTTSVGKAAQSGFVKGLTYGLADIQTPEGRHEAAARRYLDITGRSSCQIRNGYELVSYQYEFRIECPAGTAKTKAPSVTEQVTGQKVVSAPRVTPNAPPPSAANMRKNPTGAGLPPQVRLNQ